MTLNNHHFISFEPSNDGFVCFLSFDGFVHSKVDPHKLSAKASRIYTYSIGRLKKQIEGLNEMRSSNRNIPARSIWEIGDTILKMIEELAKISLQLDDLYGHLMRDVPAKRMWLEKIIIFRRYIPKKALIPLGLNWGKCRGAPKTSALAIVAGETPRRHNNMR